MYSSVAPVGSLGRHDVRSVLETATKALIDPTYWSLGSAGLGFEVRHVGPGSQPQRGHARETLVQGGRIVMDLQVAIRARGVHPSVQLMPDADEPNLLAVVLPQGRSVPTPEDLALFEAIARIRDDPGPTIAGVPAAIMIRLRQAAKMERSWLAVLSGTQVGEMTGRRATEPTTGPAGGNDPAAPTGCVMAVVGSLRDLPTARLQAGQALERVLLTAISAGVRATVLPDLVAEPSSRQQVRDVIGGGLWPHCVIRLGSASPNPRGEG